MMGKALGRRTFLRGVGTAVALPFLDAMTPAFAAAGGKPPLRMAFVYVPNGVDVRHWNPEYEGKLRELSTDSEIAGAGEGRYPAARQPDPQQRPRAGRRAGRPRPLLRHLSDGRAGEEGSPPKFGPGFRAINWWRGQVGKETRFPSLEMGLEDARQSGDCDSGYSCAYTNNLAWRSETQPLPPMLDPRSLFERLFGDGVALSPEARRDRRNTGAASWIS